MIDSRTFRCPEDLASGSPLPRRVLIVGSCLSASWSHAISHGPQACPNDMFWIGSVPEAPPQPFADYDFQIVQVPLRFVLPDLSLARLAQNDLAGHENLFAHSCAAMRRHLESAMRWNVAHGLLTFVFPFLPPQQNPAGRLFPRYDLRNMVYFIERLNQELERELANYANAYLFDFNEVLSSHGRRYFQDDVGWGGSHGSAFGNYDEQHDTNRLEPTEKAADLFDLRVHEIMHAGWAEMIAMWRTITQPQPVKLVVVDLDDTMWRGVLAELSPDAYPTSEGWPVGFWEALAFCKRRGLLLAIISKNEEATVRTIWPQVLKGRLSMDAFAVVRINWQPKAENLADILAKVNLLPGNVLYIDDNPVERAALAAAFPGLRVLGGTPLLWRRLLLWSAETQLPMVTEESANRTAMVQAQVQREESRAQLSREEFLAGLNVRVTFLAIDSADHPRFGRAFELINKTNQFNTTGRRWTHAEAVAGFAAGMRFLAFEVTDAYTDYGLVGVMVLDTPGLVQFVMSCRILGLEVETAAVALAVESLGQHGAGIAFAAMVETERNLPCRDLYQRCGFTPAEGGWQRPVAPPLAVPAHIHLGAADAAAQVEVAA